MAFKSSSALWEIGHFKAKLVDYIESNGHILKWGVNEQRTPLFVEKGNTAISRVGERKEHLRKRK